MAFRTYQQLESSDCGIACNRMIARHYGKKIDSSVIAEECDMSRLGISIGDIVNAFKKLDMDSLAVKVVADECEQLPLPCVLYWDQHHFVVLYKIKRGRFYIADPKLGKMKFAKDEFLKHWMCGHDRGFAVLVDPTEAFESRKFEAPKTYLRLLAMCRDMFVRNRRSFASIISLTIVALVADLFLPLVFQRTIDDGINGRDIGLVWLLILAQLLIFIGNYVSNTVVECVLSRLGLKMGIEMVNGYLSRLISLPIIFYARKVNSDFIQKAEDQHRLKDFMLSMPHSFFFNILTLLLFSCLLVYYNWWIFAFVVLITAFNMLWTSLFLRRRRELDYAYSTAMSENRNNMYELVHGMAEIKTNGAQQIKINKWKSVQEHINDVSLKKVFVQMYIDGGNNVLSRLKDIVVTGVCATLVIKGSMSIGQMMTVSYIIGRITVPFNSLVSSIVSIQDACMSYARVEEIMDAGTESRQDRLLSVPDGDLVLKDVSFKYPGSNSPYVLQKLNFKIEKGKTTALVGASGCGKTTLIKLLVGMFEPAQGQILIGETPLGDIDEAAWLEKIGVVLQTGTIFSGTILENIALADETPDLAKAEEAARLACLDEFISAQPMGYNTKIGVAGIEVSGGQKQRLLIARAIYKDPEMVILDEATSSLDAINEAAIVGNLTSFFKNRTVVISAHRLSTVRNADNIVFLDRGRIMEQGNHQELLAEKGHYYTLVRNQL